MSVEGVGEFRPASSPQKHGAGGESPFKRAFDVVGACALLTFSAPLLAVVAVAISLDGGPVLFRHKRVGRNGRTFSCLKFRSMAVGADDILHRYLAENADARREWNERRKLTNDPRVTVIGKFIRRTSVDELPQLINVVRGEMSLVGPRPVTTDELSFYGRRSWEYMGCIPGITGLWQISGRSGTTYRRRVALDTLYARRRTFGLDMEILFRTVPAVLFGRGAE
ncbi:MAG: sugar transferase [Pseudomonadota bacterium]